MRPSPTRLVVSHVQFAAAPVRKQRDGLLGFVRCVINGALRIDGLAVRRTASQKLTLSFPVRTDAWGRRHDILRPTDDITRREFESQIFSQLALREDGPR